MRVLGFWSKVLGWAMGAAACFMAGYVLENGLPAGDLWFAGYVLIGGVCVVVKACDWHRPVRMIKFNVAERPGARQFPPGRQPRWLPHEAWLRFPDPLPDVPDVTGRPDLDVPEGDVPPDETLRRLWLVRAQLAAHLDPETAYVRTGFDGAGAVAVAAIGLVCASALTILGRDQPIGDKWVLGGILASLFLLLPFARALFVYTEPFTLVAHRKQALRNEETRLMALDARRTGGPLAGPPIQPGTFPYIPPDLTPYRPTQPEASP